MIIVIIECVLCLLLAYVYYKVATSDKINTTLKIGIIISAMGVFAFDRIKLILFLISIGILWLIKHNKKPKQNEFT